MYRQKDYTKIEITENLEFILKIQNLNYKVFKHSTRKCKMDYKNQFSQLVEQMKSDSIQAEIAKHLSQAEMNLRSLSTDKEELDALANVPIPDEPRYRENRMQRRARERAERKQMNKAKGVK